MFISANFSILNCFMIYFELFFKNYKDYVSV